MIAFKILVYLTTIPFILFWLWIGIKALRGKLRMQINFLGKKIESRWSIVLVSTILIIKNSLILSSTAAINGIAIMLMEKYQGMQSLWLELIREIGRFNQPWFWDYPHWYSRNRRLGVFLWLFCHTLSTCAYIWV